MSNRYAASVLVVKFDAAKRSPEPGTVKDEALTVGRTAESFPAADEDYFKDMDGAVELTANEVKGRNNWIVWTGGNDRFWDHLASKSFGAVDLLKILSSHPSIKHLSRDNRWQYLGLVNEPCFEKAKGREQRSLRALAGYAQQGLPADPFENEQKYPGVKIGARGKNIPGRIVLRLCVGNRRPAAFPESGLRRSGAKEMGCGKILYRPQIL